MHGKNMNKTRFALSFVMTLACIATVCVSVQAEAAEWDAALKTVTSYTFGDSREPLSVIEDYVKSTSGDAGQRKQLEKDCAKVLRDKNATIDCKDFICRQLWVIGTKESIPALSKMLADEETSDMARYALERNTSPDAGKALRNAMKKAEGRILIGLVNSLGERRDTESVDAICKLVFAFEEEVDEDDEQKKNAKIRDNETLSLAAISALGKIGGEKAMATLADARRKGTPKINRAAAAAILYAMDNL